MRGVLEYSLGPVPRSLATIDGGMVKTQKSKLLDILEEGSTIDNLDSQIWIFDGMAIVQEIAAYPDTFGDLAVEFAKKICNLVHSNPKEIHIVFDRYPENHIKDIERRKRATGGSIRVKVMGPGQKTPAQMKKFLADGKNKMELTEFLYKQIISNHTAIFHCFSEVILYVTQEEKCHKVTYSNGVVSVTQVSELFTDQVEADTRMFLHAAHIDKADCSKIVLYSPDTDVEVLATYFQPQLKARLFISRKQVFVDISKVMNNLGVETCKALPGYHALTGCDTTSAFAGRGKKRGFPLIPDHVNSLQTIGESFQADQDMLTACESFVCALYGHSESCVNELRYTLFCKKNISNQSLPPSKDALYLHLQRVNYQTCIWKRSLVSLTAPPDPRNHGWYTSTGGGIEIEWTKKPSAPAALLNVVACSCGGLCAQKICSCVRNNIPCTDACRCTENCVNIFLHDSDNEVDDSDDEDDI